MDVRIWNNKLKHICEITATDVIVGVYLIAGGTDAVVGDHVVACRAEDVVGIQGGNEVALEECLLHTGVDRAAGAAIHHSPVVAASVVDVEQCLGGGAEDEPVL